MSVGVNEGKHMRGQMNELQPTQFKQTAHCDDNSYEIIVTAFEKLVYNIAYRMTENADDAVQLAIDAFVLAYRRIRNCHNSMDFKCMVCRYAITLSMEHITNGKHINIRGLNEGEEFTEIILALQSLTPQDKAVIVLRDVCSLTYEEAAIVLRIPSKRYAHRLAQARNRLLALMNSGEMGKENI